MDGFNDTTSRLITANQGKKKSSFTFELLTEKHVPQVLNVFTQSFINSEPMTEYVGMTEPEFRVFATQVVKKAVEDKLSIVALDKDKVVALALSEDMMHPLNFEEEPSPKFGSIFNLLETLGKSFFSNKQFPSNTIAHLFITAVDEKYRGLGLSRLINFKAMELAAKNNYHYMYCEFTNYLNEKGTVSHIRLPKRLIGDIQYKNFIYLDQKPFANLDHGAKSYLWQLNPDAKNVFTV